MAVLEIPVPLMKRLCKAASLPDAHILRGLLGQEGIEAHVFNENAQSGVGQLPVVEALPELWVEDERDFERAQEIVRRFESGPRIETTLRCTGCGEDNPGNFQLCWSCGAAL
jgi:Putative prokaryotic signal transducing protein